MQTSLLAVQIRKVTVQVSESVDFGSLRYRIITYFSCGKYSSNVCMVSQKRMLLGVLITAVHALKQLGLKKRNLLTHGP